MSRTIKFARAGGPEVLEFVETQYHLHITLNGRYMERT
jgi:hypothetical protein